jgi:3-methylfumaryl-CoA hydratase
VTATPYAGLAAVLDRPASRPPAGTPLPPLWHWLYFLPLHKTSEMGPDGHARRGDFLPPVPLPRRMWAGSRFVFRTPLRVGDIVHRTSTIEGVASKEGKSGPLVFVKVRHEVRRDGDGDAALVEWHDIVYRAAPRAGQVESPARPAPAHATWTREWQADDVLLFRYSALTFNGHRIHYDRRYATEVEGYPGLVVHGPPRDAAARSRAGKAEAEVCEFRAMRPIFDLHPFHVRRAAIRRHDCPVVGARPRRRARDGRDGVHRPGPRNNSPLRRPRASFLKALCTPPPFLDRL